MRDRSQSLAEHWHDERNLANAMEHIRLAGGRSPGVDGIELSDSTASQWYAIFREVRHDLRSGTYEPGPSREVKLRKASGRGVRTIRISNLLDRIISRAIYQWLAPWIEPDFDERSFAFRGRVGTWHALHSALHELKAGRTCWLSHDLVNAFDHVPRNRLLDLLRCWAPAPMLTVMERLLDTGRRHGIPQGSALSPLLLNLYLDKHLDKVWRKQFSTLPLLRYADDILIVGSDRKDAESADAALRQLLTPIGFKLSSREGLGITDLMSGECAQWLGYSVANPSQPAIRLGSRTWEHLERNLARAQASGDPGYVHASLRGCFDYLGPCYKDEDRAGIIHRAAEIARAHGQDGVSSRALREAWRNSSRRWRRLSKRLDSKMGDSSAV